MRQAACHPDLVLRSKTASYIEDLDEATLCRLCQEVGEDVIKSKCNHCFDRECISTYLTGYGDGAAPCPVCNATITIDLDAEAIEQDETKVAKAKQGILGRLDIANWRSSTKLEALVEELTKLRAEDVTTKSLVFSQFVSFRECLSFWPFSSRSCLTTPCSSRQWTSSPSDSTERASRSADSREACRSRPDRRRSTNLSPARTSASSSSRSRPEVSRST